MMKNSIGKICYNSIVKSINGSKVLLISPTEESSRRIWFELQKVGKQATFFTVKTPYPTEKTIEEGYDIAIRTGISNIITIGSGSICDIGKGISNLYENNVKKVNDLKKNETKKIIGKSNIIPILSIASTISPVHSTSSWLCLHQEDDILVNRSCKSINEVVFDHEFIEKSTTYCKEAILGYLLANLYDTIFSYCLHKSINGYNEIIIKEEISIKVKNYLETITNDKINKINDNLTYYSNLAIVLGELRSDIYKSNNQICPSRWPGIIEKACFINLLKQNRINRPPFSWYISALLPTCFDIINNHNDDNNIISSASKLSYKIFSEIIDFDNNLSNIININSKIIKSKMLQLKDINNNNKDKDMNITASQLLEIEIMNAEFKDEKNDNKKDPLLEMLNSDIMLDITEKIFESNL